MHVVVTGASSGIGRDLAKVFDEPGNVVSVVARRQTLLEELQKEIQVESHAIAADLAEREEPLGWLARAEALGGPIDVLVNNAGLSYIEPVEGVDQSRIDTLFQVNVNVPIAATRHVLKGMLERRRGVIVNVASVAAFTVAPYMCHYHATKGALGNFSECLALELRGSGVHVVSVYPGPIHTEMAERNFEQFTNSRSMRLAPTGDTRTLARLVHRAVQRREARVIYPRFYRLAWWLPGLARLITRGTPFAVTGDPTPPMPGDLERPVA